MDKFRICNENEVIEINGGLLAGACIGYIAGVCLGGIAYAICDMQTGNSKAAMTVFTNTVIAITSIGVATPV